MNRKQDPVLTLDAQIPSNMNREELLSQLSTEALNKLLKKDSGIIFFGCLFSFYGIITLFITIFYPKTIDPQTPPALIYSLIIVYFIFSFAIWFRIQFMRLWIFAVSILLICSIIGIIGVRSFYNASLLFGKNRLRRKDISLELRRRSNPLLESANPIEFDMSNIKIRCKICKHFRTPNFGIDNVLDRGNCLVHNAKFKSEHSCEQFSYNPMP
nr:hypothetical protein [uncultured Holophaga sp.]